MTSWKVENENPGQFSFPGAFGLDRRRDGMGSFVGWSRDPVLTPMHQGACFRREAARSRVSNNQSLMKEKAKTWSDVC